MRVPEWFKEAIVYSLDFRSFKDGNRDGFGDISGLISKFDYLVDLGVTCIWLAPFYCSNQQDDGYDVTDYYQIDPNFGALEDFRRLVEKAKENDIKIVLDLVVNHTSDAHPWFKTALENPSSVYHDYYIWMKQKPGNDKEDVVFQGVEESNWEYSPAASAYFYHTFYKHQPDLNVANPAVQSEILRIIDFWMSKGIDGFRIDAVPHILRDKGDSRFDGDPYDLLNEWRSAIARHNEQAVIIGEADVDPEGYVSFLDRGRMTALFNFYLNNYTFLAFAVREAAPLFNALRRLPLADGRRYLNFLRNHDELDLERLTEDEQQQVFEAFAPSPTMIIYERGIRRRLSSMVEHDSRRMKFAMSLLLTLPGVPVIRYGEEIGMGDDLNLPERKSVRTAMQWTDDPNGGYSEVPPQALKYPLIQEGAASYERVNVSSQLADGESLLCETKAMIRLRKDNGHRFYDGKFMLFDTNHQAILAYGYRNTSGWLVIVHNFSDSMLEATVPLTGISDNSVSPVLNAGNVIPSNGKLTQHLPGYGYSWFIVHDNV